MWPTLKQTFSEWWEDGVSRLSASLAYFTVFSIAPLLVLAVRVAALWFGEAAARRKVASQLRELMGQTGADAVDSMLKEASAPGAPGTFATILGIVFFVYAAGSLFTELQDAMNTIWEVRLSPQASWWMTIRRRLVAFAMVLMTGVLLVASLVASTVFAAARRYVHGGPSVVSGAVNLVASLVVFTALFAIIFKVLPDVRIRWRDVWTGASVTAGLFALGKYLLEWYLSRAGVTSVYGAAGSVAVLLLWVYYSAHVLFLGTEFTQVYARRHGRRIEPAPDAIPLTERDRAERGIPRAQYLKRFERQIGPDLAPPASPAIPTRRSWMFPLAALLAGLALARSARVRRGLARGVAAALHNG